MSSRIIDLGVRHILLRYLFKEKNNVTCFKCLVMKGLPIEKVINLFCLFVAGNRNCRCHAVLQVTTTGSQQEIEYTGHLWPVQSNVYFGITSIRGTYSETSPQRPSWGQSISGCCREVGVGIVEWWPLVEAPLYLLREFPVRSCKANK